MFQTSILLNKSQYHNNFVTVVANLRKKMKKSQWVDKNLCDRTYSNWNLYTRSMFTSHVPQDHWVSSPAIL